RGNPVKPRRGRTRVTIAWREQAPRRRWSEELGRPDHRPPHVRDRAVVVAEAFLRLAEMPADHVGELVELHLLVGVEGIDVADRDHAPGHVPLVLAGALVLVLEIGV